MPIIIQNTDLIGSGTQISESTPTILYVTEGTIVANDSSNVAIFLGGLGSHSVHINGEVISERSTVNIAGDNNVLTIGTTGVVSSSQANGPTYVAAVVAGDDAILINYGSVSGGTALLLGIGNGGQIINSGIATGMNAMAIDALEVGASAFVLNSGFAFGTQYGQKIPFGLSGQTYEITNTGTLGGGILSILGNSSVEKIYNSGELVGDVDLGGGNDLFDGRGGSVDGLVRGGDGDDIYIIDDTSLLLVEVGGEGSDLVKSSVSFSLNDNFENLTLIGSADINGEGNSAVNNLAGNSGRNTLSGRGGADTISGFGGADLILGGASGDTLNGDDGDDVLRGGKGNDTINGGNEDDLLRGGSGSDDLKGGNGEDRLIGGADSDTLNGGAGADMFVFRRATDSKGSDSDHIVDFEVGLDQINLSGLNSGLTFIGSAGFSGTAPEVRVGISGADSVVRIDLDGDGTTDMRIDIDGVTGLSGIDFLL